MVEIDSTIQATGNARSGRDRGVTVLSARRVPVDKLAPPGAATHAAAKHEDRPARSMRRQRAFGSGETMTSTRRCLHHSLTFHCYDAHQVHAIVGLHPPEKDGWAGHGLPGSPGPAYQVLDSKDGLTKGIDAARGRPRRHGCHPVARSIEERRSGAREPDCIPFGPGDGGGNQMIWAFT